MFDTLVLNNKNIHLIRYQSPVSKIVEFLKLLLQCLAITSIQEEEDYLYSCCKSFTLKIFWFYITKNLGIEITKQTLY